MVKKKKHMQVNVTIICHCISKQKNEAQREKNDMLKMNCCIAEAKYLSHMCVWVFLTLLRCYATAEKIVTLLHAHSHEVSLQTTDSKLAHGIDNQNAITVQK